MKKRLFLFLFSIIVQSSQAQYKPLPMQNAEWINYGGLYLLSCPQCTFVNYKYFTSGDTVINALTYVKIKKTEYPNLNNVSVFPTYTGAIRQDTLNKKIYVVLTDSTTEHILYDFSLQVGDTNNSVLHTLGSNCFGYNTETVYLIDTIQVNGNDHRVFHFQGSCTGNGVSYIEGIGSDFGLLFPNRMDEIESHLSCLNVNSQTYYPYSTANCVLTNAIDELEVNLAIDIFPNPASDLLTISIPENSLETKGFIFDQTGKEVLRINLFGGENQLDIKELENGMYIVKIDHQNIKWIKH